VSCNQKLNDFNCGVISTYYNCICTSHHREDGHINDRDMSVITT